MKRVAVFMVLFLLFAGMWLSAGGQKEAEEAEKVTNLEFWTFIDPAGDGVRSAGVKHIIETFEENNPGIKINSTVIAWNEIGAAVLRAAKSGKTPDLCMLNSATIGKQIAAGAVQPLNPWFEQMSTSERDDLIILSTSYDGSNLYGIPYEIRAFGLMYRMDLVEQKPDDLTELAETAKKFQEQIGKGASGIGIALNPSADRAVKFFVPMAVGAGAKILNDDGTADFNSPGVRKAMQYLYDLVHEYEVMPLDVAFMNVAEVEQLFESGRLVFAVQGTHKIAKMRENAGEDIGTSWMPVPGFQKGKDTPAMIEAWNLAIPASAKNPDAAWKMIQHWVSPEMQLYQAHNVGYIPMRKSLGNDPSFETKKTAHIESTLEYMATNPLQFEWPENTDVIQDALGHAIVSVLSEEKTIEEALMDAERDYNNVIK